ncbi:ABC transporter ATP-binding protein [Actinomadura sp.]|jgi:NitT/TauT family transport system ATP-binding protein|uniref:ABC transporter ATP-binding protein n=1 Tax=Actinomadura sp. TaxID=1989 RepID=UPI0037C72426
MSTRMEEKPMSQPVPAISVEQVTKEYVDSSGATVKAMGPADLTMRPGELVTVIGPSGCGKSTLLHVIGGMIEPTHGAVQVEGRRLNGRPQPDLVSFVFQDPSLFAWRTLVENIELVLKFRGVPRDQRRRKALAALERVGMGEYADRLPEELSGGMRQRVAVARALAVEAPVMLMDEPFAALDEQSRLAMGEDITRILEGAERTVVMVTHSLSEAIYLADRVIVMSSSPGTILSTIDVDEPRPRDPAFMLTPRFAELRNTLFQLLHPRSSR